MTTFQFIASFRNTATRIPNHIAVVDCNGARKTTFAQLDEMARRVAAFLRSKELSHNTFIPIMMPSGLEYLASELGIWMAGYGVVPLGDQFPAERVAYITADCEAPFIVDEALFAQMQLHTPAQDAFETEPQHHAALFYTSGSTGRPKGIVHTFASLDFQLNILRGFIECGPEDRYGSSAPFYFIATVFYFRFIEMGAQIHIYSDEVRKDVKQMEQYIIDNAITAIFTTPSVLHHLSPTLNSLRMAFIGGERLSSTRTTSYKLINIYGMTETTGPVMFFEVDRPYENTPIGKPGVNVILSLLDEEGNPVSQGEPGEICLKGTFTAGYHNNPEQTERLFRGGVLHTGDIGQMLPDGNVVYLNRNDWMVKVNGQRVEPGEIAQRIRDIEGIKEAVVKGFTDESGSAYLCAYYISDNDTVTEQQIVATLQKSLPSYMIPAYFERMERFPVNQNGKLDYKGLQPPSVKSLRADYVAPRNNTEELLCEAFASVLGVDRVGIDDDFVRMGGNSIRMMAIQRACPELPLSSKMIYTARTPRKIAECCAEQTLISTEQLDRYPLSQTQLGIYIECMNREGEAVYNNPRLFQLGKEVDAARLATAVEAVIAAHPYVRMRISVSKQGQPCQMRSEAEPYKQIVETVGDSEFETLRSGFVRPFDLHRDELFRIRVIQTDSDLYLFTDFHHIIYDGTSHGILISDIDNAYHGNSIEQESFSGFEVALQEEALRQREAYADGKAWYKKVFDGLDTDSLPLPDLGGGEQVTTARRSRTLSIPYDAVATYCNQLGVTVNSLSVSAFGYLLGTYTNLSDALLATVYNGRNDIRTDRTIGMLVKTFPVYCRWSDDTSVREFMNETKEQMMGSMNHDIYSFAEVCAEHSLSSKILFAYQGDLQFCESLCGGQHREIDLTQNATGEILQVELFRTADSFTLHVEYHANLYSKAFIDELMECYETLLHEFMRRESLREVTLVSRQQTTHLDSFNPLPTPYDDSQSAVSAFRTQAALTPDNTAVVFKQNRYSYREVDLLSDRIARHLRREGAQKGEIVSVLIGRSEYMAIASLGVLKSGAAYQPLDPTYPAERLNFMMKDADVKLLIADRELRDIVFEYEGKVLFTDEIPTLPESEEVLPEVKPEDHFILLYTSGSTGLPKGCKLTHANIVAFSHWYRNYYSLTSESRVGTYASYGFDANMMDTYPALTSGSCLYIIEEEIRLDFAALNNYLLNNQITHQFLTTQVGRQFAQSVQSPYLKHLSVGGEKLVPLDPPQGYKLHNLYGPTETTVLTNAYCVNRKEHDIPIGKAIDNLKLYIVDKYGRRLPVGAVGELWISGRQVSDGYLNRPEQTAMVFIKNPFCDDPHYNRIYRSGDIVRYRADGNMEFVGRRDGQVKIRGFRIELTEVEGVIREFEGIKDATVVAFDDPNGGKFIAAYVVSDTIVDVEKLNAFIEERKPPYMVPAATVQLEAIPLNQNMKVNRKALIPPTIASTQTQYEAPRNDSERALCEAFAEVLKLERVGIDDDFIRIGGDSIRMMSLPSLCPDLPISTKIIYRYRTPRLIAEYCAKEQGVELQRQDDYPLSQTQLGIYIEAANHPGEALYNGPRLYRFEREQIDPERLVRAIEATVEAHPYIKMTLFTNEQGEVRQKRNDTTPFQLHVEQISEAQLPGLIPELMRPFDLFLEKLFRFRVILTESALYLYLNFHHIIHDGSSYAVLVKDLETAYKGGTPEQEQYSGFEIAQQEELLRGTEVYTQAKEWYRNIFSGMDVDSLPMGDCSGEGDTRSAYRVRSLSVSHADSERFCHRSGITMNALCSGAFGYLLGTYGNMQEALFATIYNGRNDIHTQRTIGMLVKTLPLYCKWEDNTSITDFVTAVKEQILGNMTHDIYSFAEVCAEHGLTSKVLFAYQGDLEFDESLCGAPYTDMQLEVNTTGEPLSIQLFRQKEQLTIRVDYHANLYSETFIDELISSYETVLREFTLKSRLDEVRFISDEMELHLDLFNPSPTHYDDSQSAVSAFRAQAALTPDNTAVVFKQNRYSYREVDLLSDRIARHLRREGAQKGEIVSVLIGRSEYMAIASLGVLKSGAAYQPLDPTYPAERLNFMMKDAEVKLLIADRALRDIVSEYEGKVLFTDEIPTLPESEEVLPEVKPEDHFILLYTSGSTGLPKGCKLIHANIVAFSHWYRNYYSLTSESRVGTYASYGFDANMMDTYPALTSGSCLCIIEEEIRLDFAALNDYLLDNQITHTFLTTQVGRQFAQSVQSPYLKHLSVGGEKLVPLDPPQGYKLHNLYGPTETTVLTNAYCVSKKEHDIPIGKAIDNLKLYIVDKHGRRLPVGAVGELWISGRQVSDGYLNRPEQTAMVFIKNPFCDDPHYNRIYRSGDIVRYRADGNMEFVGRRDGQVKIRGFRIELTEVEGVIREFEGIKDATVVAFDDPNGGKFIAAYVVSDTIVDVEKLNAFIEERKPPYMVPAATVQLEAIPLNQNMKVNRKALPKPEFRSLGNDEGQDDTRPLNILEREIKEIVSEVVNSTAFGVTTDLAYMGLTSISSIKLATTIYKRFGVNIPSKQLTKGGSVQLIEEKILHHWMNGGAEKSSTAVEKSVSPVRDAYPLSYSQQGVYYDCMKRPSEVVYNIPSMISFDAGIDEKMLADAVRKVIEAHPYVMTRFDIRNSEPVQIREQHEVKVDIKQLSEDELAQFKREFVRPFNLSKSPLYRLVIVRTERRVSLLVDFHHLIFDGASLDIFFNVLKRLIEESVIETETFSYYDYIDHEQEAEKSSEYGQAKDFFHSRLEGCEGASVITADLSGNESEGRSEEAISSIDGAAMDAYCRTNRVTPAALCLSGVFYTLSRYVNSKQVYLSTISNGRSSDLRTSNSFGMFVKTLPLAAKIGEQTVEEFIHETADLFDQTIAHENYPFAKISADYGFTPEIMYACQLGVLNSWTLQGKAVEMEGLELAFSKFKLSVHIEQRGDATAVVLYYNNALYSRALMEGLAASMSRVIDTMVHTPGEKLKKISMLTGAQQTLIEGFHESGKSEIETKLFHHSIEQQAELRPDHTALIAVDRQFSYSELNAEANRIAHGLIKLGVQPRSRVAILLPRTSRVILSMFGVMKSGSAYIPCDPDYPAERIAHILDDADAAYVITTAERIDQFEEGKAIDVETLLQTEECSNPMVPITPDDLAYLIYTSGSTGKPKGVMLHHLGICNYLTAHPLNQHVHALVADNCTLLSVTTVSFDMSLKEIATALFNGLTLVFASEQEANDPIILTELFERTGANAFNATPSRMLQYMELPAFCKVLARCKVIMCGGEKYADKLLGRLQQLTYARIFNTYGPTEITVSSNCKELTHADRISIGRPLLNYTEFIVDADENELPVGVVGELYIGGSGVARGYNNLDEMTRERFVEYRGVRVYKSGDYARWTPEGDVEVLGRTDNQVKLRGLRIELGEVEAAITKAEAIKSAVVIIRQIHGGEHLCAYFTADRPIEIDVLKEELRKNLAQYMIPTAYRQLDSMPLTPNGKINLKSLPDPELAISGKSEAAADSIEQAFCDIFAGILSLESVGATDNFFDLGGTSLVVTRIIIEANNAGYKISYGDVFTHPTPRRLALLFRSQSETSGTNKEITDYDYAPIDELLEANNLNNLRKGSSHTLRNILLTGGSGYLGIHILYELLCHHNGKVYCLLRSKPDISAEMNLKSLLFYYFENSFEELFGSRIFCVEGDVTRPETINALRNLEIDTVINCAANVKHFSEGNDIEEVNIGGATNLTNFCLETGARLIHVSTMSVSGLSVNGYPKPGTRLTEQMLYFGQYMDNKYINSKFLAERLILENIRNKGLDAKIMRVGNLSARNSDGEFQINYSTNSFMGRLRSYKLLNKCSFDQLDVPLEFSPIDEVAKAILLLSTTPRECCVFHPYNHHFILLGDIFTQMKSAGFDVECVEPEQFAQALSEAEKNPTMAQALASMIAYRDMAHGQLAMNNVKDNTYTMQVLYRLGYRWPITSWEYVTRFIESLQGLGFFD